MNTCATSPASTTLGAFAILCMRRPWPTQGWTRNFYHATDGARRLKKKFLGALVIFLQKGCDVVECNGTGSASLVKKRA